MRWTRVRLAFNMQVIYKGKICAPRETERTPTTLYRMIGAARLNSLPASLPCRAISYIERARVIV